MNTITAGDIKRRGISALNETLESQGEAVITVRGKERYVVMTMASYNSLHEAELAQAVRETRADYKAGRITDRSVKGHIRRLADEI